LIRADRFVAWTPVRKIGSSTFNFMGEMRMNANSRSKAVLGIFGSLLLTTAAFNGKTFANGSHAAACSVASLKGSYGFYRTGSTPVGPLAALGSLTFDGAGNVSGSQSISRNGVLQFDIAVGGPYVVNPDCTGKLLQPDGVTEAARLVITDRGDGFFVLSETAGNAVYGVGRRISVPEDSED
jgi:hypothetical protein